MKSYEPGPELDVLVAEKVMGLDLSMFTKFDEIINAIKREENPHLLGLHAKRLTKLCSSGQTKTNRAAPRYSTDIRAAWEVVEKVCEDRSLIIFTGLGTTCVTNRDEFGEHEYLAGWGDGPLIDAIATTAPHAICLAALRACDE
jgi:hypothetical protein